MQIARFSRFYFDIVQYAVSELSDIPFAVSLQKLRKEVEDTQQKLTEAKAKVQSLESKSGWFERRLAETEVCCCITVLKVQISKFNFNYGLLSCGKGC